jgi:methyl-accepting chemotaxis protein
MENLTQEQIAESVSAAFDSVNLINELNAKTDKTQEDLDTISRNVEHLIVMMSKEWFVNALTSEQTSAINAIING